MDPTEAVKIIQVAGGDAAFAQLLGLDRQRYYLQRVNNWKRRGIPARVVLEHQLVLEALRRKIPDAA